MNAYEQSRVASARRDEENRSRSARARLDGAMCGLCVFHDAAAGEITCRKSPPDAAHGWPKVSRLDWCGAFTRKEAH